MDRLVFFLCLLISIIQIVFIIILYKKYWKKNHATTLILIKVFLYLNLYRIVTNSALVDILRIFSGGAENKEFGVSSVEIFQVYLLELVSNLVYFSTFTLLLVAIRSRNDNPINFNIKKQSKGLIIIIFFSICNVFFSDIFKNYLWLFKDALFYIGPICSFILLVVGIKYQKKTWIIAGIISLTPVIALNLIAGLRGTILGIAVCFIIISLIELNRQQFKRVLIIGILPFIFLALVQEKLSEIKYAFVVGVTNETIDISSAKGYIDFVSDFFNDNLKIKKNEQGVKSIFRELEYRYGASSLFAVGFLRIGSRNEFVYFKPILNSFYSFLPRQLINTSKPVSGSADGSEKTMGMYVCYNEITGNDISMTDFFVSGHYYWELGWVGVLLFSLIPALYNIFIILFARNLGYFGIAFLLLSFKPYWLLSKLWLSEIIIMIPTVMLPTILMYFLLKLILSVRLRYIQRNTTNFKS